MSLRYIWEGIRLPNFMDMAHFPSPLPSACAHRQLPRASDAPHTFGIRHAGRRMHSFVIGATGQGKTTLLRNVMLQDIAAGHGVALIDPHSDVASSLLDEIPPSRTHQVVYVDPADLAYPLGMNIFDAVDPDWYFLVADQLMPSSTTPCSPRRADAPRPLVATRTWCLWEHDGTGDRV
jgi:hypothetical protein